MSVSFFLEAVFQILFGWFAFLIRVIPRMTWSGTSIGMATVALLGFTLGLHLLARKWCGRSTPEEASPRRAWRWRSSLAIVLGTVCMFAAGTAMVGMTHQVVWLVRAEPSQLTSTEQRVVMEPLELTESGEIPPEAYAPPEPIPSYPVGVPSTSPNGLIFDDAGQAMHSYITRILPYLPISNTKVHWNLSWRHPANRDVFASPIPLVQNPALPGFYQDEEGYALTHFASNRRVLGPASISRLEDVTDGAASTIMIGEVNTGFRAWGDPVSWRDPAKGLEATDRTFSGPKRSKETMFLFVDGGVRAISDSTDPRILKAMATPNAGD